MGYTILYSQGNQTCHSRKVGFYFQSNFVTEAQFEKCNCYQVRMLIIADKLTNVGYPACDDLRADHLRSFKLC